MWCLQGKPRPKVTWLKEGKTIEPTDVSIRNTDCDSIIFIRKAERSHSGKYEMNVQVENHVDTAILDIQIVGEWTNTSYYRVTAGYQETLHTYKLQVELLQLWIVGVEGCSEHYPYWQPQ